MIFTDNHLYQLKHRINEYINQESTAYVSIPEIKSLITRLEAAERYAEKMHDEFPGWYIGSFNIWNKAAGK